MAQATEAYRAEMDVVGQFLEECCLTGTPYRVPATPLYDAYKRWCDQTDEPPSALQTGGPEAPEPANP